MSLINLNDAIPAAPAGVTNIKWQADSGVAPRNVSAYVPVMIGDGDPSSPLAPPESGAVPAPAPGDSALGKFLKADGTWEVPAGGPGSTHICETPAGLINGVNTMFTLSLTPAAESLELVLNGVAQSPGSGSPPAGEDFTVLANVITYVVPLRAGDEHTAWYSH